jgi:hypothetical protein
VIEMATATDDREEVLGTTPEALRDEAIVRLKKRRDLTAHAFVYVVVNAVVWGIWTVISLNSHSWWPWPNRKPITEDELRREIEHLQGLDQAREHWE